MRTISLWQPWASLVAIGAKRIETRSWPAPASLFGQRIGIHASKTKAHLAICEEWPFHRYIPDAEALPLGAVVATAVLDRAAAMTEDGIRLLRLERPMEAEFGLYEIGRFAWILRDVRRLAEPVVWRGSQGFFDVPDHLLDAEAEPPAQGVLL